MNTKIVWALALVWVLALSAGCSVRIYRSAPSARSSSSLATAAPVASDVQSTSDYSGLLTGTELKAALVPASYFTAAGFSLLKAYSSDSGPTYSDPSSTVAKPDCSRLSETAWIQLTGLYGESFAQSTYSDASQTREYAEQIDVMKGVAGAASLSIGSLAGVCPSFTDPTTHTSVKVAERPVTGVGEEAFRIVLTDPAWGSPVVLESALAGTAVVTVTVSLNTLQASISGAEYLVHQILHNLHGRT